MIMFLLVYLDSVSLATFVAYFSSCITWFVVNKSYSIIIVLVVLNNNNNNSH